MAAKVVLGSLFICALVVAAFAVGGLVWYFI